MIKGLFSFTIVSPFDKEKLICEICYKNEILAEISQEEEDFLLEIYPTKNNKWWQIPLKEFQDALETGRNHLIGEELND